TRAAAKPGAGFPASSGFIPRAAIHRRPKTGGENQIPPMIHALSPANTIAIQLKIDVSKETMSSSPGGGLRLTEIYVPLGPRQAPFGRDSGEIQVEFGTTDDLPNSIRDAGGICIMQHNGAILRTSALGLALALLVVGMLSASAVLATPIASGNGAAAESVYTTTNDA